ncbi:MAG: FMN-binding protein [Chloroflexi bacterium]|nr:FMN-binding protein [Chloroflexota bacterium]
MSNPDPIVIPLTPRPPSKRQKQQRREHFLIVGTVLLVVIAWLYGYLTAGADVSPLVENVLPGAASIQFTDGLFVGYDADGNLVGYAAAGSAPGYSGPIVMLVGVDPDGNLLGVMVVEQSESPGFFRLVDNSDLLSSYANKPLTAPLQLGEDLDAVTGATVSAEGVASAVRTAVRDIAANGLNVPLPPEKQPIQVGWPELILVLLFASGYVGHKLRGGPWKQRVRWGTLIAGMVFLGFIYTAPLTITMIISLLSGYWPDWHSNLYWYMLIGGILFVTTVDAKNPYCSWFCPFGAFQECVAAVSRAKRYHPRDLNEPLKWVQRGLALTAVLLGLALRRPGVAGYEPFATLFDLRGTPVQWVFLLVVVFASLMTYRPFCNYLCPIDPVVDMIAAVRRWLKEAWAQWRQRIMKS